MDPALIELVERVSSDNRRLFEEKTAEILRHVDEKAETQRHFDEKTAELKLHFDVTAEALRSEIRLLPAGVGANTERIDVLRAEMKADSAETRALLRLS